MFKDPVESDARLQESSRRFTPVPCIERLFLPSLPKSGTNLVRSIFSHFIGYEAVSRIVTHLDVYEFPDPKTIISNKVFVLINHLPLYEQSFTLYKKWPASKLAIMFREPLANTYSLAKHIAVDSGMAGDFYRAHGLPIQMVMDWATLGREFPPDQYVESVEARYGGYMSWLSIGGVVLRYEDMIKAFFDLNRSETITYIADLLGLVGADAPIDWQDRLRAAFNPEVTWTSSADLVLENKIIPGDEYFRKNYRERYGYIYDCLGYKRE